MIIRNLYKELEKALPLKQVIVITGLRRVGKTTSVKYLLGKIKSANKLFLDLERVEHRYLFNIPNYQEIVRSIEIEGIDFSKKAYIAIDEIQLVPGITSVIKYLYDTYAIKFIVTGSSSFYLKNHFNESLAGRKLIFELYPLTFDEYLRFIGIKFQFPQKNFYPLNIAQYNKLHIHYTDYIEFGGFPEVALVKNKKIKTDLLKDIINSYLKIDIKFLIDFSKVNELYKLILLLTGRVGSKVDFSKIASISGIDRKTIKEYLQFFEQTYLIKLVPAFVKNQDREIALQKKIYFSDNGLLQALCKMNTAQLLENSVANQLSMKGTIKYYARKNGQEIDFILNDSIAFEVKETPHAGDSRTLKHRAMQLNIEQYHLIGLSYINKHFTDFIWAGSI